ncbi:MAG: pyridoxamine 5'-phosphate oxidase [Deltaproteobacteria bacterium]|nr:MAG: pyridoxamine 5'-phosphate oxidase [Deltaproteobacteria bacterium]
MDLKKYFNDTDGIGVMSTADDAGKVNGAIYARPHLLDDGYLTFIMRNRLNRNNLQRNPYAHYLFLEKGNGFSGIRIYLEKVKEVQDDERIAQLARRKEPSSLEKKASSNYLVSFKIIKIIQLIGDKELTMD